MALVSELHRLSSSWHGSTRKLFLLKSMSTSVRYGTTLSLQWLSSFFILFSASVTLLTGCHQIDCSSTPSFYGAHQLGDRVNCLLRHSECAAIMWCHLQSFETWASIWTLMSASIPKSHELSHIASAFWDSYVAFVVRCLTRSSSLSLLHWCSHELEHTGQYPIIPARSSLSRQSWMQRLDSFYSLVSTTTSLRCFTICIGFVRRSE